MDFEKATPQELRKEADRRELIEKGIQRRRTLIARDVIAETIAAIPRDVVRQARMERLLRDLLSVMVKLNEEEPNVTNGEISMLTYGGTDINWWRDAMEDEPQPDENSFLYRFAHRRMRLWGES